jgi:hypothetical protein
MEYSVLQGFPIKIARAEARIAEVSEGMNAYLAGRNLPRTPYELGSRFEPLTSECVVNVVLRTAPPPELGGAFGEAAHALRSALDHLAWDLVRLRGKRPTRKTKFPVFQDESGFNDKGLKMVAGITSSDIDIIKSYQPFIQTPDDPRNHLLVIVSWIDNIDKHQVLHATLPVISAAFYGTPDADGYYESPIDWGWTDFGRSNDTGRIVRIRIRRPTLSVDVPEDIVRIQVEPTGPNPLVTLAVPGNTLLFSERKFYLGQLSGAKTLIQEIFNRLRPEFES